MAGPYDHFIGKLWPGAYGWLPLDENGTPNGPAHLSPPSAGSGVKACHVWANDKIPLEGQDALLTATGAPITDNMTPNTDFRPDPQMYKSAPMPGDWVFDSEQDKW
jgi:hypothetical protein